MNPIRTLLLLLLALPLAASSPAAAGTTCTPDPDEIVCLEQDDLCSTLGVTLGVDAGADAKACFTPYPRPEGPGGCLFVGAGHRTNGGHRGVTVLQCTP